MNKETWLDIKNVETWNNGKRVFTELNLELYKGETTVIFGPNGSGKSGIINLINRVTYPVIKGESHLKLFSEINPKLDMIKSKISFLSTNIENRHSGLKNVREIILSGLFGSIGISRNQISNKEHEESVDLMLNKLELRRIENSNYSQLSDGQKRRVLLARALIKQPEILVLDEPTRGLDLKSRFQFINELRKISQTNKTILMVTHNVHNIYPEVDRLLFLKEGSIIQDGPPDEILTSKKLTELFDLHLQVLRHNKIFHVEPTGLNL